jgi:hypothetical protein
MAQLFAPSTVCVQRLFSWPDLKNRGCNRWQSLPQSVGRAFTGDVQGVDVSRPVPFVAIIMQHTDAHRALMSVDAVRDVLKQVHAAFGEVTLSFLLVGFERHLVTLERREAHAHTCGGVPQSLP